MPSEDFISKKAQTSIDGLKDSLKKSGYVDSDGIPSGAGIHLIPLLKETFIILEKHFFLRSAAISEPEIPLEEKAHPPIDEKDEDCFDLIKKLYLTIRKTITDLRQAGFDEPDALAFELIIPQMNWMFCLDYAYWSAMTNPIEIADRYEFAFQYDHPDEPFGTISAFLEFAKEKNAIWSIKITEKGLKRVT